MGNKLSVEQKRALVDEWRESGLTQTEFCKRNGVSTSNLSNWKINLSDNKPKKAKLASNKKSLSDKAPISAFIPFDVTSSAKVVNRSLEIHLPYGIVLKVPLDAEHA